MTGTFRSVAGSDKLTLASETTAGVAHTFTNATDGSVTLAGDLTGTITYTSAGPITDGLTADDRAFTFTAGAETIALAAGTAGNEIASALTPTVGFANPTTSLTIDAGAGADTATVAGLDAAFGAGLTITGGAGADVVNLNAGVAFAAGLVSIQPQTLGLAVDLGGADAAGTLGLSKAELAAITAGPLKVAAAGPITVSDAVAVAGGLTLSTPQSVRSTTVTVAVTATNLVGTAADPLDFAAATLATNSAGDQFLAATGATAIGVGGLYAGGDTIRLAGGPFALTPSAGVNSNLQPAGATLTGTGVVAGNSR